MKLNLLLIFLACNKLEATHHCLCYHDLEVPAKFECVENKMITLRL